jgi:hypothetical protein
MNKILCSLLLIFSFSFVAFAQEKSVKEKLNIEDGQSYLVLSTVKIQTMEKELDEAAAQGFRVLYGAPTASLDMALFLKHLEKSEAAPYTYKILATSRFKTMEKEMNEIGVNGFRLLPRTIIFKQGFITSELAMVLEHAPDSSSKYEYKLIYASKETKLHKKIDESTAEGFVPVTMITLGANVIVMEKEIFVKP